MNEEVDIEEMAKPCANFFGPCIVRNLEPGKTYSWCACGLSENQPFCDGSHKGTSFKPLKWKAPETQSIYSLCACKYTNAPPYCDATHIEIPLEIHKRQVNCAGPHDETIKLCEKCGWSKSHNLL